MRVCSASQKGKRKSQEDRVVNWRRGGIYVFGVFDGHAGHEISAALPGAFAELGRELTTELFRDARAFKRYIRANVVEIDEWLLRRFKQRAVDVGSTASVGFYDAKSQLFYAMNLGDSRGIFVELPRDGPITKRSVAMETTLDHKPDNPEERKRIRAAGGKVQPSGPDSHVPRVAGVLALSRAFGDYSLKVPFNEARGNWAGNVPDVTGPHRLDDPDKEYYLTFNSDGITDMLTSVQVRNMIVEHAKAGEPLDQLCKSLVKTAIARWKKSPGGDNCTTVVAHLR